jgi:hypothetical protein
VKRSRPLKRTGRLKQESDKVRARKGERATTKALALERDRGCVASRLVPDVRCVGPLDGHERLPRSRGGSAYDLENVITVCRIHHDWIHGHPIAARELNLLA